MTLSLEDADYNDYRELVCFERPACVWLHFFHKSTGSRMLLFDRLNFSYKSFGEWQLNSDPGFLQHQLLEWNVIRNLCLTNPDKDQLDKILKENPGSALFVPYFTQVGDTRFVSTWILEEDTTSTSTYSLSSLRGDDFFVRKSTPAEAVTHRLDIENGALNCHLFIPPEGKVKETLSSEEHCFSLLSIREKFLQSVLDYETQKLKGIAPQGADALFKIFNEIPKDHAHWKSLVESGIENALLSKCFWNLQYAFKPFVVFVLRCLQTSSTREDLFDLQWVSRLNEHVKELITESSKITSLAQLYGRRPKEERLIEFFNTLERLLHTYSNFEQSLLKSLNKSSPTLLQIKGTESLAVDIRRDAHELGYLVLNLDPKSEASLIRAKICGTWCLEEQWKKVEWKIAQKLDVNCPNNLAQKAFRSKFRMRQEWNQISGQSTKSTLIKASTLAAAPLDFPFIAKPNNAFASAGVFLVKNESDWKQAANLISKINSILLPSLEQEEAGILCEEYIDGTEISVDAISCDGKTFPLGICQRSFISESNFQDYVYLLNPRKNEIPEITQLENLLSIFFKKIGHSFGPTHSEFRFRKSDRQWVLIETANRIGAGGYIGSLIENCLSIPYQKLALMASLRRLNPSELENLNIQDVKYGIFFVPNAGSGGKLKAIHGLSNFQQDPRIIQLKLTKKVGDHLRPYPKGPDYPALILASSSDRNELMALIKDIERELHFEYT